MTVNRIIPNYRIFLKIGINCEDWDYSGLKKINGFLRILDLGFFFIDLQQVAKLQLRSVRREASEHRKRAE
jgi:hypothetical protein